MRPLREQRTKKSKKTQKNTKKMPLAGTDRASRSRAHVKWAERHAKKGDLPKALAHFGRALDYSARAMPRAGFGMDKMDTEPVSRAGKRQRYVISGPTDASPDRRSTISVEVVTSPEGFEVSADYRCTNTNNQKVLIDAQVAISVITPDGMSELTEEDLLGVIYTNMPKAVSGLSEAGGGPWIRLAHCIRELGALVPTPSHPVALITNLTVNLKNTEDIAGSVNPLDAMGPFDGIGLRVLRAVLADLVRSNTLDIQSYIILSTDFGSDREVQKYWRGHIGVATSSDPLVSKKGLLVQCECFGLTSVDNLYDIALLQRSVLVGACDTIPSDGLPLPRFVAESIIRINGLAASGPKVTVTAKEGRVESGSIKMTLSVKTANLPKALSLPCSFELDSFVPTFLATAIYDALKLKHPDDAESFRLDTHSPWW